MKKLILLSTVLFFAACNKATETPTPEIEIDYGVSLAAETPSAQTLIEPDPSMRITWGWGHLTQGMLLDLTDAAIPAYFSEKYGVQIDMQVVAPGTNPSEINADIYVTNAAEAWKQDAIRIIPRDMLTRHAPRYTQVLTNEPYVNGLNIIPGGDDYYGLFLYNSEANALNTYSVYRLDWLEEAGILPEGNVEELFDRVYFTNQAFTQSRFLEIMTAFSARPDTKGLFIPREAYTINDFLSPLAGMWGLNMTSWFDGEDAAPIASDAYRDFLHFLRSIQDAGLCEFGSIAGEGAMLDAIFTAPTEGRLGWWSAQMMALGYYRAHDSHGYVLALDPNAKLLITPPEIGLQQGAGISSVLPIFYGNAIQWVINADVSDEKLAVILTMFDDLSFNPESWVIAMHGFEGTDFEWEGEPYASRVVQTQQQYLNAFLTQGTMSLHTNIYDGVAGTNRYNIGNNSLTQFAESIPARRMVIPPTRHDVYGEFLSETEEVNTRHWEGLLGVVQAFYARAVQGELDIDAEWEQYVDELYENGLQEYRELMAKFQRVGQ